METVLKKSTEFIVKSIDATVGDESHNYATKFEEVLKTWDR